MDVAKSNALRSRNASRAVRIDGRQDSVAAVTEGNFLKHRDVRAKPVAG